MSLTQHQQFFELVQRSQNPLITFRSDHNGDTIASSLALAQMLTKLGRTVDIVAPEFKLPDSYKFLPTEHQINDQLNGLKKLTISLDHRQQAKPELEHYEEDDKIHIHITPSGGSLSKENISISESKFVIASPSFSQL